MSLAPEVIAEQVMGYAVGAAELIPTLTPPKQPYSVAILPQGPHYYTGLLQAAGYLLLDGQKKKLLVISKQSDDNKNILVDTTIYGPMFGQTRETPMPILSKIRTSIGALYSTKEHKTISDNVQFQLPFFRIITETKELVHIGIGERAPQIQMKKLLIWIQKHIQEYNIVLLTNIELSPSTKRSKAKSRKAESKKHEEHAQIAKIIQTYSLSTPLLTLFQKILKFQKSEPEIIAYVNPGDFSKNSSLTTRYVCAVG
ncbi:MAG: hypothetical protein WC606_01370 [Candidatus Absconditabacterales bacterium]